MYFFLSSISELSFNRWFTLWAFPIFRKLIMSLQCISSFCFSIFLVGKKAEIAPFTRICILDDLYQLLCANKISLKSLCFSYELRMSTELARASNISSKRGSFRWKRTTFKDASYPEPGVDWNLLGIYQNWS